MNEQNQLLKTEGVIASSSAICSANFSQLKAVSLWEPWATGMALNLKHNETRSWPTAYRGPLAICSAKRPLDQVGLAVARENGISLHALRFGCVLCVVELFDCVKSEAFLSGMHELTEQEQALGDYTYGRWIWRTRNCRRLEISVPVVGHQGFWTLPPETLAQVNACLPNASNSATGDRGSSPAKADGKA